MLTLQTPLHRSMATGSNYLTACAPRRARAETLATPAARSSLSVGPLSSVETGLVDAHLGHARPAPEPSGTANGSWTSPHCHFPRRVDLLDALSRRPVAECSGNVAV
jgi:hypothetical protein